MQRNKNKQTKVRKRSAENNDKNNHNNNRENNNENKRSSNRNKYHRNKKDLNVGQSDRLDKKETFRTRSWLSLYAFEESSTI